MSLSLDPAPSTTAAPPPTTTSTRTSARPPRSRRAGPSSSSYGVGCAAAWAVRPRSRPRDQSFVHPHISAGSPGTDVAVSACPEDLPRCGSCGSFGVERALQDDDSGGLVDNLTASARVDPTRPEVSGRGDRAQPLVDQAHGGALAEERGQAPGVRRRGPGRRALPAAQRARQPRRPPRPPRARPRVGPGRPDRPGRGAA